MVFHGHGIGFPSRGLQRPSAHTPSTTRPLQKKEQGLSCEKHQRATLVALERELRPTSVAPAFSFPAAPPPAPADHLAAARTGIPEDDSKVCMPFTDIPPFSFRGSVGWAFVVVGILQIRGLPESLT